VAVKKIEKNTAGAAIFAQNPCVYQKKVVPLQRKTEVLPY
jgi:hypothetical protein